MTCCIPGGLAINSLDYSRVESQESPDRWPPAAVELSSVQKTFLEITAIVIISGRLAAVPPSRFLLRRASSLPPSLAPDFGQSHKQLSCLRGI